MCHKHRKMGRARQICNLIAGRKMGSRKRKYGQVKGYTVSRNDWMEHLQLPGSSGGAAANFINLPEVEASFHEDQLPSLPDLDINHTESAKLDYKDIVWTLKQSKKRKGHPPRSLPSELFLISMAPTTAAAARRARKV